MTPTPTPTLTPELLAEIEACAAALREGKVVAIPTETVYGLGADAGNRAAVRRVFEIKGRPAHHPVIVHVAGAHLLERWAREVPDTARRLASRFWPGPLTLVLPRRPEVLPEITGGQDTVAVRVPAHPVTLRLLERFGGGLAAPSANRFGRISPTTAAHVRSELGGAVDRILDGGPCRVGVESTIVALVGRPRLLRPGGVPVAELEEALGEPILGADAPAEPERIRAPGGLAAHYAPATPLELLEAGPLRERAAALAGAGERIAVVARSEATLRGAAEAGARAVAMPESSADYARLLYATLRGLDEEGLAAILVEAPPDEGPWLAVRDRLGRAARGSRPR